MLEGAYDKIAVSIVDENLFLIFTRLSDASSLYLEAFAVSSCQENSSARKEAAKIHA